jgi:hypothetical protein
VFLDAALETPADDGAAIEALCLENGAMLYCQAIVPSRAETASADAFAGREASAATKSGSWEELSKARAAVKVVPQKQPNCTKLSMAREASQEVAAYLASQASEQARPLRAPTAARLKRPDARSPVLTARCNGPPGALGRRCAGGWRARARVCVCACVWRWR